MKNIFAAILLGALVTMVGCGQGTSGGPGATSPPTKAPMTGQVDDTFSLIMPSATLNQGGETTVSIGIKRGQNFSEDVSLSLAGLPAGVTFDPANPLIKHGDNAAPITLKAAGDAALGDFTVKVTGHPSKGADAVAEMKVSIAKQEPAEAATEAGDVAKAQWDEYNAAVQTQWAQFNAKFDELKDRAAKATGQAKTDLDQKVAEAKIKLDEAAVKIEELKSASADRWEKVKEGVANAFEDLKKIFE